MWSAFVTFSGSELNKLGLPRQDDLPLNLSGLAGGGTNSYVFKHVYLLCKCLKFLVKPGSSDPYAVRWLLRSHSVTGTKSGTTVYICPVVERRADRL